MQVLIIGGGIAGTTAAETLRKQDKEAEITILEQEEYPCYSKVLLSQYAKERIPRERLFLKGLAWYEEQNITFLPGVAALRLDTKNRFVFATDGREYAYDKLLLATGKDVRLWEDDAEGILYWRTLDDTDYLRSRIQLWKAEKEKTPATVLGSSFIAVEFLNLFYTYGMPVVLAMRGNGLWSRMLSKETQAFLEAYLEKKGVRVIKNASEIEIREEQTRYTGLRVSKEEIPSRILGMGIGLKADLQWLEGASLEIEEGILADVSLKTNVEDIFVAGDIAQVYDRFTDRQKIFHNWAAAQEQGKIAAQTILGEKASFEIVPMHATQVLDLPVFFLGEVDRQQVDEIQEYVSDKGRVEIFQKGGCTVGAALIGDIKERQAILTAIKQQKFYVR